MPHQPSPKGVPMMFSRRKLLLSLSSAGIYTILPSYMACAPKNTHRWWIEGGYAATQEEVDLTNLTVEGEIPKGLNGLYIRNGGNFKGKEAPHYFVGDGMLHGIWLENGQALRYKNRWVNTSLIQHNKKPSLNREDNMSNTSIIYYGGRLLSLMEIGFPYEIKKDLSTKGVYKFDGTLQSAVTAHPKVHPKTGNLHFFGMNFFSNPYLNYRIADVDGKIIKRVDLDLPASSMQHDFQCTQNYALFLDLPIVFSKLKAVSGGFPYTWKGDKYQARIGVLPHNGQANDIRWFSIQTGFVFHTLNAFENSQGEIILQVSRMDKMWERNPYDINEHSNLYQYRIHPQKGLISEGPLHDRRVDFGIVDERFSGKEHKHSFFSTLTATGDLPTDVPRFSGVCAYHNNGEERDVYLLEDYEHGGEFTFVPRHSKAPEGDGFLLGYVYNGREDTSTLDIFDTVHLAAGPVARIHIQRRVPFGFHGVFVPSA